MNNLWNIVCAFMNGLLNRQQPYPAGDKALRRHLSERQVDTMVQDSFPASDPPSTY